MQATAPAPIVRTGDLDVPMRERVASLNHAFRQRFLTDAERTAADADADAIALYLGVEWPGPDDRNGSPRIQRWRWTLNQARAFRLG